MLLPQLSAPASPVKNSQSTINLQVVVSRLRVEAREHHHRRHRRRFVVVVPLPRALVFASSASARMQDRQKPPFVARVKSNLQDSEFVR